MSKISDMLTGFKRKLKSLNYTNGLLLVVLGGCISRFYMMDFQSPWVDEVHTINEVAPQLSLSEVFEVIKVTEPAPPLYYIVCHYLVKVFEYSSYTLRAFSAVLGVLGILAIYNLGAELFNRKVGMLSAIFLMLNFYHIYYSQEARVYALFFLSATLSYYFLIRLVKAPSLKASVLYGLGASLLIYSHYFGFFALASQCAVILYFLTLGRTPSNTNLLKYSVVSGIITILLFIPSLDFLLVSMSRTKGGPSWIPPATLGTIIETYGDFFGQARWLIITATGMLVLTAMSVLFPRQKIVGKVFSKPEPWFRENLAMLSVWIIVTVAIPFVLSKVSIPMIQTRYLICVLPAILIMTAVGVSLLNNSTAILVIVLFFAGISIRHGKGYYRDNIKTQFRKLSHINFKSSEPIVSTYGWYLPFFIQKEPGIPKLITRSIDQYVQDLARDTTNLSSFWLLDFTRVPMKDSTREFLARRFVPDAYLTFYQYSVIHYMRPDEVELERRMFVQRMTDEPGGMPCDISSYVDEFNIENDSLKTWGWAFLNDENSFDSHIRTFVKNGDKVYSIPRTEITRQDLSAYFESKYDLDFSGFKVNASIGNLPEGKYEFYLYLFNERLKQNCVVATGKLFEIQKK